MKFTLRSILYSLLLVAVVGCAAQPKYDSVYTRLEPPELKAGSAIPKPQADVILTVSECVRKLMLSGLRGI